MVNYGGDEIAALVVDIGTSSVRTGYAGDDAPKSIIPTSYGYTQVASQEGQDVSMEENGEPHPPAAPKKIYHVGQHGPNLWRPNMEIGNPLSEGIVTDFDPIQSLITHSLRDVLKVDPEEHPVLFTEPAWNSQANRERMAEIMFEEMNVPAFYIANSGVLNAFAAGKGTALVIDIGMANASVIPVVDGFVLRKGMQHNGLPKLVHSNAQHVLMTPSRYRPAIDLLPHQLIASKISPPETTSFTLRDDRVPQTTDTWRAWAAEREVEEWIQAMGGCFDQAYNEQVASTRQPRPYEFPTGISTFFGPERYRVGELFFFHDQALQSANPNIPQPLPQLIASSLGACDPELRQQLLGNVVLTGGGSQFSGLSDRLNNEMGRVFPGVKIHAPGNPIERRFGAWLGGSILSSLGTFHQLWISKEEWQEHGRPIVGQRCK